MRSYPSQTMRSYPSQTGRTDTVSPALTPSLSEPILRTYSSLSTSKPIEEKWGPPVINTALLSYNIGIRHQ